MATSVDEQQQQQQDVEMTENESLSALQSNIHSKGQNSYYYAHKRREDVQVHEWDGKAAPRLLQKTVIAESVEKVEPITQYAWSDSKKKVSLYVTLEGIGAHAEENTVVDWNGANLTLSIKHFEGKNRVLALKLTDDITDVKIKRKENQLVLLLAKAKEYTWHSLKKSS